MLKLTCVFLKFDFIKHDRRHGGGTPLPNLFLQEFHFVLFFATFFQSFTIISDLNFDFKHVFKLQQLLYFHPSTQALPCIERCPESKVL